MSRDYVLSWLGGDTGYMCVRDCVCHVTMFCREGDVAVSVCLLLNDMVRVVFSKQCVSDVRLLVLLLLVSVLSKLCLMCVRPPFV